MYKLRGYLVGDDSILTFTRGCADFRDPTAVFRIKEEDSNSRTTGSQWWIYDNIAMEKLAKYLIAEFIW